MPAWIHDRARHIRRKNPEMSESQSWAIASQQAHKLGKVPKDYGTVEGKREAKAKYRLPRSEYRKTADRVKQANAAVVGAGPGAATPMQIKQPAAIVSPMNVPQAAPTAPQPPGVAPVTAPSLPSQRSGPGAMMKSGSIQYHAFFDELCNILS